MIIFKKSIETRKIANIKILLVRVQYIGKID